MKNKKKSTKGRKRKRKERRTEMYLCGEEYSSQYKLKSDQLFYPIFRTFGLERLRKVHSGDLSTYLYWLVLGAVVIIILLMVMV